MDGRAAVSGGSRHHRGGRILMGLALLALVISGGAGAAQGDEQGTPAVRSESAKSHPEKVPICRAKRGKTSNTYKTKYVDPRKLGNLKPGDVPGACEDACAQGLLCDDGNACTTDVGTWTPIKLKKNKKGVCACTHPAVSCDDGNACTDDACNPASGCVTTNAALDTPCGGPPQGGGCDAQDTCDGQGSCVDRVKPSTTACTGASQAGACDDDAKDRCSGTDATCVDAFLSSSTVCRPAAGPCDVAENCSGSGAACGTDLFKDSSIVCRDAAGVCDAEEKCSGTGAACGADAVLSQGTPCTGGVCDGMAATCCTPKLCSPGACGIQSDGCGGTIDCGLCINADCATGLCAADLCGCGAPADQPECATIDTCLKKIGRECATDDECATGYCECRGSRVNSQCNEFGGTCRVPLGGDCTHDSACFADAAAGSCIDGKCVEKRLPLGAPCTPVCKTDPTVSYLQWQDCPGGVWVDERCKSFDASTRLGLLGKPVEETYCFKNALTPGNCSNSLHTLCESDADCANLASGTCNYGGRNPGDRCTTANLPTDVACTVDSDCPDYGAVSQYCINGKCGCPDPLCDADNLCNQDENGNPLGYRCDDPNNPFITVPCVCASQCMKGPMAPGQPTCCLELGQQCQDDADCCKGNHLEPNLSTPCEIAIEGAPCGANRDGYALGRCRLDFPAPGVNTCVPLGPGSDLRSRHCVDDNGGFGKICKKWSYKGESCDVDDDCFDPTNEGIGCKNTCARSCVDASGCPPGVGCVNQKCNVPIKQTCDTSITCPAGETCEGPTVCSPPIAPVKIGKGGICRPDDPDFLCDDGLECTNCNYARKGWRCLDPLNGCCNNLGLDDLCGDFYSGKECCNWQCTKTRPLEGSTSSADLDPKNCGFCNNDCTTVRLDEAGCWNATGTCTVQVDYGSVNDLTGLPGVFPECSYEPQCPRDTDVCIGAGIFSGCATGVLSQNGQGNICCVTPVNPYVICSSPESCALLGGSLEGNFMTVPLNGVGRQCADASDCGSGQICKFDCSKISLYGFGLGCVNGDDGVCVDK